MEQRGGERRNFSKEQVDVTDFYDRQKVLSFSERQQSRMVHGRNFHNWIKSVLIDKAITKISGPASVLDFCGGKGGDLLKWKSAGISQLVLVDISLNSVRVTIFNELRIEFNDQITFRMLPRGTPTHQEAGPLPIVSQPCSSQRIALR